MIEIKSGRDIETMRESCQMAADTLLLVGDRIRAGMSTDEINTFVHQDTVRRGAVPSPLNYHGFPKSVCTSVNEVVCHGIPGAYVLKDGDIINVDVTTFFKGFHGDTSATFYIGEPSPEARLVVEVARECLARGIAAVRDNGRIGDIGEAIEDYAHSHGLSVVRDFVGHGIGRKFHTDPQVAHYRLPKNAPNPRMKAGMVFTIEPMINLGGWEVEVDKKDKWTARTRDRKLSAQFEHTVLVTAAGCEVLTRRPRHLVNSEPKVDLTAAL
ncbi:MAG: type I methionyl aminopeptidase [Myxococcales bacterium]|nr:type I methionyl aminopeptidase [Myxococcales bacterium]